jgi:hypothetical protein
MPLGNWCIASVARITRRPGGASQEEEFSFTHFTYKAHWFVLAQTEGTEYQPPAIPEWKEERALAALDIHRVAFDDLDGNTQGYAKHGRKIAVSPIAAPPAKTLFHEVGHVMLGHVDEGDLSDTERIPRDVREMEAEAVSLLCCESLGLPGAEYSRGYIQSWSQGQTFTERSAQRIFRAADQILGVGAPAMSPLDFAQAIWASEATKNGGGPTGGWPAVPSSPADTSWQPWRFLGGRF